MRRLQLVLLTCVIACGDPGLDEGAAPAASPRPETPAAVTFADELGVDLASMTRLESGVYILDVTRGSGAAADSGSTVTVHYRAWLPDGTLFERRPDDQGFGASEFTVGENAPVEGLNSGIAGMRTGGTRRIVVPPELGYDLIGRPPGVPAGSTLVFEISLRRVAS